MDFLHGILTGVMLMATLTYFHGLYNSRRKK